MSHLSDITYQDSPPGFWEWDIVNQTIQNPILIESLGYEEEKFTSSPEIWEKLIHPQDWEKLVTGLHNHLLKNSAGPLVEEIRFIHRSGLVVYMMFVGKITEYSLDGQATKMIGSHIDITSRKYNEKNLEGFKKLLDETSRTAMLGGWEYDLTTNKLNWTDFTKEIFEVDMNFSPKKGDITSLFAAAAECDRIQEAFNSAVTNGTSFDLDFPIITAKGNEKWIRCTCQPSFEDHKCIRLFGVVQDITEKSKAKETLLIKEQQLSTFIKHCPVAICMLDKKLNYVAASDLWKSFFNLDENDIRGRNQLEIFPDTPEIWRTRYQSGLNGEVLKMDEESFILADGSVEWLEWEIRPWEKFPGQIGGIIIYTAVISEKYAFKEALIKARDYAEQSSLIKSKFLSVMSHEMRTPLNAVIGFINLLLQHPRADQVENMNVLKFSAENLLMIINDVLDFSKLDADKVQLEEKSFNLQLLLQNIVASLKHGADEKDLVLKLDSDQSIPDLIMGDSSRLGQIIINLLNNAIKFTHKGTVSLAYNLKEAGEGTYTVAFTVKDTGIGIPVEQQENIFDMFSQADSDTTRKYGGTGLGLSISKRLLELMGSQIHLSSSPAMGSTFSFDIVFKAVDSSKPKDNDSSKTTFLGNSLVGAKILIVEDNPINLLLMKKYLTAWQCECGLAQDGRIACDMVKKTDYDLILMDLQMPVMDGFQTTRYIRNLPEEKYKTIPIIALSANDKAEVEMELNDSGISDYLGKPFAPKQLNDILVRYLRL